jgi:hypothetical protein
MQQQFLQVFRLTFTLIKGVIYIVFTIALGTDLSHVHSFIETGIVDVIHRLLALLAHYSRPEVIQTYLLIPPAPTTVS